MSETSIIPPSARPGTNSAGSVKSVPRYRSIAAAVGRAIATGEYAPGSFLPSEADLAASFGVTRMTVRQALAGLASQGLIERRHGHGTIVVPIKLQRQPQRTLGLTAELLALGFRPGSRVLDIREVRPTPEVRELFRTGTRGKVIRLRRLRYADDVLVGLQETVLPTRHAPGLVQLDLTDRSLAGVLRERHGLAASWTDLTIEAVGADRATASTLDIEVGSPVLRSTSIAFLPDGRPLDRTVGWFPAARYSYKLRKVLVSSDSNSNADPGTVLEAEPLFGISTANEP
jgi:GntR family transcriptional regulator